MVTSAQDTYKAVITSVGSAISGGMANSPKPVVVGTAPAGDLVNIYDGVRFLGTATAAADGTWSFTPGADLKAGSHQFTAIAVDATGHSGASSTPISVNVPSSVPATPAAPVMTDDNNATIPNGSTTSDTTPHFSGTGTAGDVIKLFDGPTQIGSATVGADGKWVITPADLSKGPHDFYVTETNPAGTPSAPSPHVGLIVETVSAAPAITGLLDQVGPVQGQVVNGGATDDNRPTISGTGIAGDKINLYLDFNSAPVATATVDASGHWSVKLPIALADSEHGFVATQVGTGEAESVRSNMWTVTVDTTIPAAPSVSALTDNVGPITGAIPKNGTTDDNDPVISGTGVKGDVVHVLDNGKEIGSATVGADGTWSFKPATPLADGAHDITATQTNPATGAVGPASADFPFNVDTTTPPAPAITQVWDAVGAVTGAVPKNGTTDDNDPTISGTGVKGDVVHVLDNGKEIGAATVGADGTWSFKPAVKLADGAHDLTVTQTNAAGVTGPASADWPFTVNTHPVAAAPLITSVVDSVGPVQGNIPMNGYSDDPLPVIHGTGIAGYTIWLYDNGRGCGDTVVGADGTWSIRVNNYLDTGLNNLIAKQFTSGVDISVASNTWTFTLDASVPAAPTISGLTDNVGPITGAIPKNGTTDDNDPVISGTGVKGDVVHVLDNGKEIGSVTVGADGTWSFKPATPLADGAHDITATQTNPATGAVGPASADFPFNVDTTTPPAPAITQVWDAVGAVTGAVPKNGTTDDNDPTISGTGVKGDVVHVLDNGREIGTATVGADGTWSFKPAATLADGAHDITVTQTNAAGVTGPASADWPFNVNTHPGPAETVSITQLLDQSMGLNTVILNNGQTYCTNPLLQGALSSQLLAGETVQVYRDGVAVGTATVSGKSWSYSDSGVPDGSHLYTAKVVSSAGSGALSDPYHITELVHSGNGQVALLQLDATTYRVLFDASKVPDSQIPNLMLTFGSSNGGTVYWAPTSSAWAPTYYLNQISGTKIFYADVPTDWVFWPQTPQYATSLAWGLFDGVKDTYYDGRPASMFVPNYWAPADQKVSGNSNYNTPPQSALDAAAAVNKVVYTGVLHAVSDANTDPVAVDATQPSESTPSTEQHHTTVAQHDAFTGHTGYDTIDLNVDPTSYFKEATAHIQGSTDHAVLPTGAAPAVNTLHLTGDHQVLDLTSLTGKTAAAKISGIEAIDLGGHANTLKVSLLDVLNLGEQDLFQKDGKQQMMVNGSDGDKVDLSNTHIAGVADGVWEQHGTAQVGGVLYNVYEHSGAHTELLVQQGVQIVVH